MRHKRFLNRLVSMTAIIVMLSTMTMSSYASTSIEWSIFHNPHIPSANNSTVDYFALPYSSNGYSLTCSSFYGESGSYIMVTTSPADPMGSPICITADNTPNSWQIYLQSPSTNVIFAFSARRGYACSALGSISANS